MGAVPLPHDVDPRTPPVPHGVTEVGLERSGALKDRGRNVDAKREDTVEVAQHIADAAMQRQPATDEYE